MESSAVAMLQKQFWGKASICYICYDWGGTESQLVILSGPLKNELLTQLAKGEAVEQIS